MRLTLLAVAILVLSPIGVAAQSPVPVGPPIVVETTTGYPQDARVGVCATCTGKGAAFDLDYDLEAETSEGTVDVAFAMGDRVFCSAVPPFGGKDGSDGKRFIGKDTAAPSSCF